MTRVLVVDDEKRIREVVQYALEREGFDVLTAEEGSAVPPLVESNALDLIVLDIMLPGMDGLELCRQIRKSSAVPILFLSAKGEEIDRVLGLELGGDDYLTKPFSPRELTARVKAILRRAGANSKPPADTQVMQHGDIRLDRERHEVEVAGQSVTLTATEFGVLAALLDRPGIVLSRSQLMQRAYSFDNHVTERTIDTHVRRIRAKFREVGGADPIATVHGVGYKAG